MTNTGSESQEHLVNIIAEGVVYTIDVETTTDDLDWLDNVILRVTAERCKLRELFAAFRLPRRLVENALARLLERNLMLLDVYDGSVRASPLKQIPVTRSKDTFDIWQDHATGMLLPRDKISTFETHRGRLDEADGQSVRIRGGPPRRTPLEMSDAEVLHHLSRIQLRIDPRAEVRGKKRVGRSTLNVRGLQREDGRLALRDSIPWRLRASWARLSGLRTEVNSDAAEFPLPPRWEEVVGRWAQEAYERVVHRSRPRSALPPLLQILTADLLVELTGDAVAVTKKLARDARSSVVVAVTAGHGTPSEAVQILMESNAPRRVLVLPTPPNPAKRTEWEKESIQIVVTGHREGPDFVLTDGLNLAFGGVVSSSSTVITVRASSTLAGVVAWLEGQGVTIPREDHIAAGDLVSDLRAFEYELVDLQGEIATVVRDEPPSAEESTGAGRIRQYLKDRCGLIEARLLQRSPFPFAWLSPSEVLALVEQWSGKTRVVARDETSPLAQAAIDRSVECAVWPSGGASADCVILDAVVLIGFSLSDDKSSAPDFLAVADSNLAAELRIATSRLAPLSRSG